MQTVGLTGASGSIGHRLLVQLSQLFRVKALYRNETPAAAQARNVGCHVVIGDLSNEAALRELVSDASIVFHTAAAVTHGLRYASDVNIEGTRRLARLAVRMGCRRLVHFSSVAVYLGAQAKDTYDEETPIVNTSQLDRYSHTKWEAEVALREACNGTETAWTILRPTCVYGPGVDSWTLMPLNSIKRGMPIHLGQTDGLINAVYVDDVVDAAIAAGTDVRAAGRIYNVGGEIVPTAEFFEYYARLTGRKVKQIRPHGLRAVIGIGGAIGKCIPLPANADPRLLSLMSFCSCEPPGVDRFPSRRITEELGVRPRVRFSDGMFRTMRWLVSEGLVDDSQERLKQALGNHTFTPKIVYRPANEQQLQEVIAESVLQRRRVRTIGSLHSMSLVHAAQDVCISLEAYRAPVRVEGNQVTVPAGMLLKDICEILAEHHLALPILGSVKEQTISGAVSTGTHGASLRHGSLTDSVVAARLIDGQGRLFDLDHSDDRFFGAVQSMGLCGVLSTLTLECVPAFSLRSKCWSIPYAEMLSSFQQLCEDHEYVEFLWHPVLDMVEVFACDRMDSPASANLELHAVKLGTKNPFGRRLLLWSFNQLHRNRRPRFHRPVIARRIGNWYTEREGRSDFVLAYAPFDRNSSLPMDNHEAAIAFDEVLTCIPWIRNRLKEERHYPVLGVRFRCQRKSRHWLNAAYGRNVCWIETFNALGASEFTQFLHETLAPFNYRPHWGKTLWMDGSYLARQYPEWERFQRLRNVCDPSGLLMNDYLADAFPACAAASLSRDSRTSR